jgi:hypothetical protein
MDLIDRQDSASDPVIFCRAASLQRCLTGVSSVIIRSPFLQTPLGTKIDLDGCAACCSRALAHRPGRGTI